MVEGIFFNFWVVLVSFGTHFGVLLECMVGGLAAENCAFGPMDSARASVLFSDDIWGCFWIAFGTSLGCHE